MEQYRQANPASEDAEEAPHNSTASSSTSYHIRPTRTKIPGHNSLLFDPGSRINIIGSSTAKEFAAKAAGQGDTIYEDRPTLHVNGVGSGSTPCHQIGQFPIACTYDRSTSRDTFTANIATGPSGDHLPAILGLDSLQDKDAVVVFRRGQAFLLIPGDEGFTITHGKKAKKLPLVPAPSGHLVIPCDDFDAAPASRDASSSGETFIIDFSARTSSTIELGAEGPPPPSEPLLVQAQPSFSPL